MQNLTSLSKGDTVVIVATAKAIDVSFVDLAIDLFKSWGLQVEVGKHTLSTHHYFAGTDKERAEDFQWAIDHPIAKAIICARGGYGTIRVVDEVDYTKFVKFPKWIVGFSDITVLHHKMNRAFALPSIHAAAPIYFDRLTPDDEAIKTLHQALFGEPLEIMFAPNTHNREGKVTAPVVGGNLAIMASLIGTSLDIDPSGKILFIEDISEYAYRLDRMIWSLRKSGKLDKLAGLMVGGLTDIKQSQSTFGCAVEEMIIDIVKDKDYPVVFDFPSGHQLDNRAIVFGEEYELTIKPIGCKAKRISYGKA